VAYFFGPTCISQAKQFIHAHDNDEQTNAIKLFIHL